jgi:putative Mn2+ efflux pump MntP
MFGFFQGLMPLIGWLGVHTVLQYFSVFEKLIPWIALTLLGWIGGNMISDGIKNKDDDTCRAVGFKALLIQGIATSIDALTVGFTISEYNFLQALATAVLIAGVTFVICYLGILIGKKAGTKLAGKAGILGGAILIFIGLEIFITSLF